MNQFYYKKIAIKDHDITFKKEKKKLVDDVSKST